VDKATLDAKPVLIGLQLEPEVSAPPLNETANTDD
jgi:hypothetical protein